MRPLHASLKHEYGVQNRMIILFTHKGTIYHKRVRDVDEQQTHPTVAAVEADGDFAYLLYLGHTRLFLRNGRRTAVATAFFATCFKYLRRSLSSRPFEDLITGSCQSMPQIAIKGKHRRPGTAYIFLERPTCSLSAKCLSLRSDLWQRTRRQENDPNTPLIVHTLTR